MLDSQAFIKNVTTGKLSKGDKLGVVDHSSVEYPPFRRNFYIEVPELARMSEEEVTELRKQLDNVKVRRPAGCCPERPSAAIEAALTLHLHHCSAASLTSTAAFCLGGASAEFLCTEASLCSACFARHRSHFPRYNLPQHGLTSLRCWCTGTGQGCPQAHQVLAPVRPELAHAGGPTQVGV